MTYNAPPSEMKRVEYISARVPGEAGKSSGTVPALPIRVRPPDASPSSSSNRTVRAEGLLDTGASVSSVPLWSLEQMGITADKGSRQMVFGAGGPFPAYVVKMGLEIEHNEEWLDTGIVSALAPDTKWSADPKYQLPFLLGRRGFFDRFDMCVSETQKAVWLRRIGGWP